MNANDSQMITEILDRFELGSAPLHWEPFGGGHINRTWLVSCESGERFILQRISGMLTDQPDKLMENIIRITEHLRKQDSDPRKVLTLMRTVDGRYWCSTALGNWRVYRYVENSICLQAPRTDHDFYQTAIAFGHFEQLLRDFPADQLYEPLPDFHNTPVRYQQLHRAIETDLAGRRAAVESEIAFLLEREEEAGCLVRMAQAGQLPLRVTHNDTKLNNVLFDKDTMEPLCVIDLDTVMPGLSLYDFGDAIRFGAATAPEDEKDLTKVSMDLGKYRVFRDGFLAACPDLSEKEKEMLPFGAKVITTEQAVRFLTDYLNGDQYYHISYAEQNLDRTRTQIRLVQDMEDKWEQMQM